MSAKRRIEPYHVAAAVLALADSDLAERLEAWRAAQTASVAERPETDKLS